MITNYSLKQIEQIGRNLVKCSRNCDGIRCNLKTGHIPRCLYVENGDRTSDTGVVIIGLNPGHATKTETQYYKERNCSYESMTSWFNERGKLHPYYKRLRKFVHSLNLNGTIIWTELAKCESAKGVIGLPPLQTLRVCTDAFLKQELKELPLEWPLIAVGTEAYKGLAYSFPDRTVIGVPHPTGSRGHFHKLFTKTQTQLKDVYATQVRSVLAKRGVAIWFTT